MVRAHEDEERIEPKRRFFPWLLITGVVLLVIIVFIPLIYFSWFFSIFQASSHLSFSSVSQIVSQGYTERTTYASGKTYLILGLDKRSDGLENTLLTDAMILVHVDPTDKNIVLLPIPRDLWIPSLETKVNALYYYGSKSQEGADAYMQQQLQDALGISIDGTLTLNYARLPALIDLLGGVDIDVPRAFTDTEFPNPSYTGALSKEPIYITISFEAGMQHMDGQRALQYVRSRHSTDAIDGNDEGRSDRQMHLFRGIVARLMTKDMLWRPEVFGSLYRFWKDDITSSLSDTTVVGLGFAFLPTKGIALTFRMIPTSLTSQEPILVNPPVKKYGQWVWEPVDGNMQLLQSFIQENLQ